MKHVDLHHEKLGTITLPESAARVMAKSGWRLAHEAPEPEILETEDDPEQETLFDLIEEE